MTDFELLTNAFTQFKLKFHQMKYPYPRDHCIHWKTDKRILLEYWYSIVILKDDNDVADITFLFDQDQKYIGRIKHES